MDRNYQRQKTIIILRGLPGSGRTSKARALKKARGGGGVIISTWDYLGFGNRPPDPLELHRAHMLARWTALQALENGVDPVIINNPNMPFWHMYPYVLMALKRLYWIQFVEMPNTWNLPLEELQRRSRYIISLEKMENMKESYQEVGHIYDILNDVECIRWWRDQQEMKDW